MASNDNGSGSGSRDGGGLSFQAAKADPLDQVAAYFESLEVAIARVDGDTLTVPIEISAGMLQGIAHLRRAQQILVFYAASPQRVPADRRGAVAEYITRANYGLPMGNFEMDFADGEVRFRVSMDYEGTGLSPVQINNVVQPAVHLMDRYLPGLMEVAYGGKDATDAIAAIES